MSQLAFSEPLNKLLSPAVDTLAGHVKGIAELHPREREVIVDGARANLTSVLHGYLARTLLLELHIARNEQRLLGTTSAERWRHFIMLSSQPDFWRELQGQYPDLPARLDRVVHNRCAATIAFARAWAADRASLDTLCGGSPGLLCDLHFNAGDSHKQGRTVIILTCESGKLVYKPRPADIDTALANFLSSLADAHNEAITATVPRALTQGEHSWAAFAHHRYAANEDELRGFYRGIGQWLGILLLLGGTDMHSENLIASGARPVIVDCETLFTPRLRVKSSGYGDAVDRTADWIQGTVLGIGMLPARGQGLAWRGVDASSVGALPDQQPTMPQPVILNAGTDEARWGMTQVPAAAALNHPSPQPVLLRYWPQVVDAFDHINDTLRRLDAAGLLAPKLDGFADCTIRVVPRPTEVYAELARMLWHPVSLHNEQKSTETAHDLLRRMAANSIMAPNDAAIIDAEIAELKEGDIPFFFTTAARGQLQGPGGTHWLQPCNLVDAAFDRWRAADLSVERQLIHAALKSAYLNENSSPDSGELRHNGDATDNAPLKDESSNRPQRVRPEQPQLSDLDQRRRALLNAIVQDLSRHAIHGEDGTVTWPAPGFDPDTGWSIRPMPQDLYSGLAGVALLLAAYRQESNAGRADPIVGLDRLLQATISSLCKAEEKYEAMLADRIAIRPLPPGGYVGLGNLVWTWLVLDQLGAIHNGITRACAVARLIPQAADASQAVDILHGVAGAIPPLLTLARRTADPQYLAMAGQFGDKLITSAVWQDNRAHWMQAPWPNGIGGFSHGATGIGWALAKLARAGGETRYQDLANAAFAFEESLYDTQIKNWLDRRDADHKKTLVAWCHGAIGIGLAHLDLDPNLQQPSTRSLLRRAVSATWHAGLGNEHCLCHGNASNWEFLDLAIAKDEGPPGISREAVLSQWLTRLEQKDVPRGIVSDTFARGFMTGTAGIAYQLLRAAPGNDLPSALTLNG